MNCSQGWVSLAPGLRAQEPAALCGVHRDKPLRDRDASLLPEMTTRTRLSGALRKLHQIRSKSQTQHQSVRQKLCHEKHVLHGVAMLFRMAMFYCATECSAGRRRGRSQTRTQPPPRHAPVLTRGQSLGSKRLRTTRRSRAGAARGGGTPCATSRAGRSAAWSGRTFLHTERILVSFGGNGQDTCQIWRWQRRGIALDTRESPKFRASTNRADNTYMSHKDRKTKRQKR